MRARKVLKAHDGAENQFLGYVVDSENKVVKGSKQCWGRSDWNELSIRILIKAVRLVLDEDDDECTYVITIAKDDAPVTYTDHKLVFRALKVMDIDKRLSDWKWLKNKGRLVDPAVTNKKWFERHTFELDTDTHTDRHTHIDIHRYIQRAVAEW